VLPVKHLYLLYHIVFNHWHLCILPRKREVGVVVGGG